MNKQTPVGKLTTIFRYVFCIVFATPLFLLAVDTDGDGVPDSIENVTQTDPNDRFDYNEVIGWGQDNYNQVSNIPGDLRDIVGLACGQSFGVALSSDGTVRAWGSNVYNQLVIPPNLGEVIQIDCNVACTIALRADGTVVSWGRGFYGEDRVPGSLRDVTQISCGPTHTLALKKDRTLVAWGQNWYGLLSLPPDLLGNVISVSAGTTHNLALKTDGTVRAWGQDYLGKLDVPNGLGNVVAIAAGLDHSVAVKANGTVVAWGDNQFGQTDVPSGLTDVIAVSCGTQHTLALKQDGTVVAWGRDIFGAIDVPDGLSNVQVIGTGNYFNLTKIRQSFPVQVVSVGGSVTGDGNYQEGEAALLVAQPDPGFIFTGWSGDHQSLENPLSLEVNSAIQLTAHFALPDSDEDGDGISAETEKAVYGTFAFSKDSDSDGLLDNVEISLETDPTSGDSDGDGLGDFEEVETYNTNPTNRDSDGDRLSDFAEILNYLSDPNKVDTDSDGFDDFFEVSTGFDPTSVTNTPELFSAVRILEGFASEFRFYAAKAESYTIESSADLENWETVETGIVGAGNTIVRFYIIQGTPKQYFRAKRQ